MTKQNSTTNPWWQMQIKYLLYLLTFPYDSYIFIFRYGGFENSNTRVLIKKLSF